MKQEETNIADIRKSVAEAKRIEEIYSKLFPNKEEAKFLQEIIKARKSAEDFLRKYDK